MEEQGVFTQAPLAADGASVIFLELYATSAPRLKRDVRWRQAITLGVDPMPSIV
jgi:hypothetical protein